MSSTSMKDADGFGEKKTVNILTF